MEKRDAISEEAQANIERKAAQYKQKKMKAGLKVQDAIEKSMEEFKQHKKMVPQPTVIHDKPDPFKNDILINNFSLIVGGKHLLEDTSLKLVQGRKYGLVGRNGIGKTCLINAITRKELEGWPENIHILQVEQEAEADEITVLEHVLNCDVERTSLLKEQAEIVHHDESKLSAYEKEERTARLVAIGERLTHIQAEKAESKAIQILIGLGF